VTSRSPWIIAHRGDTSDGATENTIAAFAAAILAGVDMIELDVHHLRDGVVVVFHDEVIRGSALRHLTYREVQEHASRLGVEVPTFDQALQACRGQVRLVVELKSDCASEVLHAMTRAGMGGEAYVLASFNAAILARLRRSLPDLAIALLTERKGFQEARPLFERVAATFWAPDQAVLDDAALRSCAEQGIRTLPWTVNETAAMRRFMSAPGVAGLITDRPREALQIRRALPNG
jgi:glycerophosphoryl diester phosphodiesterase